MPYNDILAKLKDAIRFVSDNIHDYVVKSKSDFTQKGKLTPEKLIAFLIGQGSKSTRNELIEAFNGDKDHPTASALVQKRAKLLPSALSEVLYRFNKSLDVPSSDSKYRFFAADGSTFTFLSDSRFSSEEYFTTQGNSAKGCYSIHLTAFLDLDSNRYTDTIMAEAIRAALVDNKTVLLLWPFCVAVGQKGRYDRIACFEGFFQSRHVIGLAIVIAVQRTQVAYDLLLRYFAPVVLGHSNRLD